MKKKLLLFTISAFLMVGMKAQSDFQLGLNLSPNFSWFKAQSDDLNSDGLNFGFNYGLVADFNISENYAFSTGLMIVNAGGEIEYPFVSTVEQAGVTSSVGGVRKDDVSLSYIEIPLTLKLKTNEIGYLKYYGQFGVGLSANYRAKADTEFTFPGANEAVTISDDEVDFADEINLLRASLIVGLGVEYNLSGNTSLILGATFNNGFTNVLKEDAYNADQNGNGDTSKGRDADFKAINNYLILNVGVLF